MDTVVKSHCVATHKKMHQTNWLLPRKVKHAFLILIADRQQRKALAVHYLRLSLSESSYRFLLRCSVQDEMNHFTFLSAESASAPPGVPSKIGLVLSKRAPTDSSRAGWAEASNRCPSFASTPKSQKCSAPTDIDPAVAQQALQAGVSPALRDMAAAMGLPWPAPEKVAKENTLAEVSIFFVQRQMALVRSFNKPKYNCILEIQRIRSVATSVLSTVSNQKRTDWIDTNPLCCHRAKT